MKQPAAVRLDKLICDKTSYSRREAHKLIRAGKVTVNGVRALAFDHPILRDKDAVVVCGREIPLEEFVYLMLNKPGGYVSATEDKLLPTVLELVPETLRCRGLFPAGRLDKDTTGFVLLTNDGDMAHGLLSPRSHVEKEYLVTVDKALTPDLPASFLAGVVLPAATRREREKTSGNSDASRPILCQPATLLLDENDSCTARVILRQGMFHQIKRMFEVHGYKVTGLHRLRMGGVHLDEKLGAGELRPLTADEIRRLTEQNQ